MLADGFEWSRRCCSSSRPVELERPRRTHVLSPLVFSCSVIVGCLLTRVVEVMSKAEYARIDMQRGSGCVLYTRCGVVWPVFVDFQGVRLRADPRPPPLHWSGPPPHMIHHLEGVVQTPP